MQDITTSPSQSKSVTERKIVQTRRKYIVVEQVCTMDILAIHNLNNVSSVMNCAATCYSIYNRKILTHAISP